MHNNEERFRVAASFQFRSSRGAETNASERRGEKGRKREVRVKADKCSGCRSWQKVFGENGKTIVWAPPSPYLPMLKSLSESLHENLSINQKIYKFCIRNEELSLSWAESESEPELENYECLPGLRYYRPCSGQADSGSRPRRIQTKTNNINFKTLRCISN